MRTMAAESPNTSSLSLPVREDGLWPPGELVQIIGSSPAGFKGGGVKGACSFVITLTRNELLVRGAMTMAFCEDDITEYSKNGIDFYKAGYDHLVQDFVGELRCDASSITKVLLGRFGAGTRLEVWIADGNQRDQKVISVIVNNFLPKTIMKLANYAADEVILKRSQLRGYNPHAWPLYRSLIQRGFRRAAPNATVIVKGKALDEETLGRLVC